MAKKPSSRLGGILGALVAVVLLGGLIGTPFYLNQLAADRDILEASVEDPVEEIRRVILNLDENLTALSDLYATAGNDDRLDREAIVAVLKERPKIRTAPIIKDLEKTALMLMRVESDDQERGTSLKNNSKVLNNIPDFSAAAATFRNTFLTAHKKLLQQAQQTMRDLQSIVSGEASAANHLGTNRIKAIYYFTKGRIEQNRAEFEQWQATLLRRHAEALARKLADLHGIERSLPAQAPTEVLEQIQEDIASKSQQIELLSSKVAQLSQIISQNEARLAELDTLATDNRMKMSSLEASNASIHEETSDYQKLSVAVRQAEAQAAAIRNGTLDGAKLITDDWETILTASYEGGQVRPGLRLFKHYYELGKLRLAGLEKTKAELLEQKSVYDELQQSLDNQTQSLAESTKASAESISGLLAEADEHLTPADQAANAAIKSLTQAERYAKAAVSAASRRVREARSDFAEAVGLEADRLKMITDDKDMEAAMKCLIAEIAYHSALTRARQMEMIDSKDHTAQFISAMAGETAPETDDETINDLRSEALNKLANAKQAYDQAAQLISKSRAKTTEGSIQGKDYLWQIKIGQAAVHLLNAVVLEDAEAVYTQKVAAYDLLTEAAQGREQSPLLATAIDTLSYLQHTTK